MVGTPRRSIATHISLVPWCGVVFTSLYFFRGTVLPQALHAAESGLVVVTALCLLIGALATFGNKARCRWEWVFVLVAFAAGIWQSTNPKSAALRWTGLTLLLIAAGPVIVSPSALVIRSSAWRLTVGGLATLTAVFFGWYALRLPSLGAGDFASFMNHCMLLGPIAGLGIIIALTRVLHGRSWCWGVLAILGVVPLLAAGSRIVTLAAGTAACVLVLRRKSLLGALCSVLFLLAVIAFAYQGKAGQENITTATALSRKGMTNSREDLWRSRIEEFKSSPLLGVGIGIGGGGGAWEDRDGIIRVEPGSSYLAVLAMTGAIGTLALCGAVASVLLRHITSRVRVTMENDILMGAGIFFAIHGIAEGWILSFGSPLCFLFWLWLGNFQDAAELTPGYVSNIHRVTSAKLHITCTVAATNSRKVFNRR